MIQCNHHLHNVSRRIQSGIYHGDELESSRIEGRSLNKGKLPTNSSFALLLLRANRRAEAGEIGKCLAKLWKMYEDLRMGKVAELPNCIVPSGSLSVLIAYGPKAFELRGIKRQMPSSMKHKQFLPARSDMPILDGSGIKYSKSICSNLGLNDHVAIQLISSSQLATNRAIVETWRLLHTEHEGGLRVLRMTGVYSGFKRDDGRSWLGFHDEVSNMKTSKERDDVIRINRLNNRLSRKDLWTEHGTYMAFLRIEINLRKWWKIETKHQEIIVGRNKSSGFPLIGIDKNGNPITGSMRLGSTFQTGLEIYSEKMVDHPNYHNLQQLEDGSDLRLDIPRSIKALNESHIGRTRHMDKVDSKYASSRRIFRQGFDFIEWDHNAPYNPLSLGLNFVSFQNDPGRLLFILTDPNWLGGVDFGKHSGKDSLIFVLASGIFFVPRHCQRFPGSEIFL